MLKIGQNWGKLQIIPPNVQQRSAPLIVPVQTSLHWLHLLRISSTFIEENNAKKALFCGKAAASGLVIIAVCKFQRFSDRSFVCANELIFILKLDWTVKSNFQNTKRPP